jgi:pimeloyl-ACP methyl ester carboxylesterase
MFPAARGDVVARFVNLPNGLRVRVLACGPADGPPLLFIHGWSCSIYVFRKNYAAAARAGFRVYAPDLKGHGLSDKPLAPGEYTGEAMSAHVRDIMDALGVRSATLVGHSMGGSIAARVALDAPERVDRLVLLSPVGFGEVSLVRLVRIFTPRPVAPLLHYLVPRALVNAALHLAYGKLGRHEPRDVDEYWAPAQFRAFPLAMRELLHAFDWGAADERSLARLRVPTLVIFGTHDRFVSPTNGERLARAIPGGRWEVIEGGGHVIPEEAPDRVNAAVLRFLNASAAA